MLEEMIGAYNGLRDEFNDRVPERIKAGNGGVLPSKYDETSGKFPDPIISPPDILNESAGEIDGVTCKGSFVVDDPIRLDTTKLGELAR